MRIALHDADHTGFPNFALMKISTYHKRRGDSVEWFSPLCQYDRVYSSKVFTFSPDNPYLPEHTIRGGTGYGLYENLPEAIEAVKPDYTLYPDVPHAIGFLTRGCIRKCPWCCVPQKEGAIRPYRRWEDVKREDSRDIVFMDNNALACEWGLEQIERMGDKDVRVDFNQGLDARLITPETAKLLAALKWHKPLRMSCDTAAMMPVIEQAVAYLREARCTPRRYFVYMLVTENVREAEQRAVALDRMGLDPFAQPYRDFTNRIEPNAEQKAFARWVNHKAVFHSTAWKDYSSGGWSRLRREYGYGI